MPIPRSAAQKPPRQEPMEASAPATSDAVVTQQPRSEPPPQMDTEISLRGGSMNLGCSCCHGSCSFHKSCC
ncbi:hypothetical protein CONLIGDRAFT_634203 [Coniochaeta ligniaria NRRL 30616]|uniref:Uncharacterized protein n=1 Tax=Coniochaeta ligniaria NRRL 30616 TaxID=1408157 RepID=A0A1J7J3K7_9PEZI|nr:hypothetical protein CONLIGDRAFT_634203 [Coniochaeta ligniaria NRRL 30616]